MKTVIVVNKINNNDNIKLKPAIDRNIVNQIVIDNVKIKLCDVNYKSSTNHTIN